MTTRTLRVHRFHATTVVSTSRATDAGAITVVRYNGETFYRVFPIEGRAAGINGGSLVCPSPVTLAADTATRPPEGGN